MKQTTLCVPLDVKPDSSARLVSLIEGLKQRLDNPSDPINPNFSVLINNVPVLHFMSISVFLDSDYDPILIIEANFDGPPGPFWAQLEAQIGEDLRNMLRCCKPPRDATGELYKAVTGDESRRSVAPYLEVRTQAPSVFHHGNRGLTRQRILAERELFLNIREAIDPKEGSSPYRGKAPETVHALLRAEMLNLPKQSHVWLDEPAPARISLLESVTDWAKLLCFAALVALTLAAPGILIAALYPGNILKSAIVAVCLILLLMLGWRSATDKSVSSVGTIIGAVAVGAGVLALNGIGSRCWLFVIMGLSSIIYWMAVLVLWLRGLELRDSSHDSPELAERIRRKMLRREDWVTQNHMGSIVLIKPGVLRCILIHVGHWGLHLYLRAVPSSRAGYLGSMRTVHFAHWAFLNNSSRLIFLSNFDHSWDSYLDDFIEKAHAGLTLAWSCGVGFPTTKLLLKDGAKQGRQFKAWALASRTVSRFWFSAYPDLTVDQIERNHRIANGLRTPTLSSREASEWIRDL
jgi:hypothetical protein